jgi:hypothetical protein
VSSSKSWEKDPLDRKESRTLYLSISDWNFLREEGKGSPVECVRNMIMSLRQERENEE